MSYVELLHGDCADVMALCLPDNSVDAIVTDPPYGLAFMGKRWDYDVPAVEVWAECLRVLKPGGHLLAFAGTRTQHRMAVRIEDAGFEIRDMIAWVYGSGFPKSLDVSKAIDKTGGSSVAWFGPWFRKWREDKGITQKQVAALFPSKSGGLTGCVANWELGLNMPTPEQFNLIRDTFGLPFDSVEAVQREVIGQRTTGIGTGNGATPIMRDGNRDITAPATEAARQWHGWGTALKPALEPITVARKPLLGTVAANVLEHGTGALNIDACRVPVDPEADASQLRTMQRSQRPNGDGWGMSTVSGDTPQVVRADGRWPANLIHDGSDEVAAQFPETKSGGYPPEGGQRSQVPTYGKPTARGEQKFTSSEGSAARFFYCAKSSKKDRGEGNTHPTVKPTELMRYLVRLVTPPGGLVLDPFMGSGSTGKAAVLEGFRFVGIDMTAEYVTIAKARIEAALMGDLV